MYIHTYRYIIIQKSSLSYMYIYRERGDFWIIHIHTKGINNVFHKEYVYYHYYYKPTFKVNTSKNVHILIVRVPK